MKENLFKKIQMIPHDIFIKIIFEMNRFYDYEFTKKIKELQISNNIVFNDSDRKKIRKFYYYGNSKFLNGIDKLDISNLYISPSNEDIKKFSFHMRIVYANLIIQKYLVQS